MRASTCAVLMVDLWVDRGDGYGRPGPIKIRLIYMF